MFERIEKRLDHLQRTLLNQIWKSGGVDAVNAALDDAGLKCPVCGNAESSGPGMVMLTSTEAGASESECPKCGHKWETSDDQQPDSQGADR